MSNEQHLALYRILDANGNRAGEALRVVEECARFTLNDQGVAGRLKNARHALATALNTFALEQRLRARNTEQDVGTQIDTSAEYNRPDTQAVVQANMKRLQQALRALEEYGKVVAPDVSHVFEQLRYETYTLEAELVTSLTARSQHAKLTSAHLYVLIEGHSDNDAFAKDVDELVAAGVHIIQLRDKQLNDRELLLRARTARDVVANSNCLLVINDRPDIAMLANAHGVHVGQEELEVQDVRSLVGDGMLVGVSTHDIHQAREAQRLGADYIGCGPTFRSTTKQFDNFPAVAFLSEVAEEIRIPAFAIGGIDHSNLKDVLATGMTRIAVAGAVTASSDRTSSVQQLLTQLTEGQPQAPAT